MNLIYHEIYFFLKAREGEPVPYDYCYYLSTCFWNHTLFKFISWLLHLSKLVLNISITIVHAGKPEFREIGESVAERICWKGTVPCESLSCLLLQSLTMAFCQVNSVMSWEVQVVQQKHAQLCPNQNKICIYLKTCNDYFQPLLIAKEDYNSKCLSPDQDTQHLHRRSMCTQQELNKCLCD